MRVHNNPRYLILLLVLLSGLSLQAQETMLVPRRLKIPGEWGYADSLTGKMIISPRYVSAGKFDGNLAIVCKKGLKYAFIDKNGKEMPSFNKSDRIIRIIIPSSHGGPDIVRYLIYKNKKYGMVDPDLNLLIPIEYKNILVKDHLLVLVQPDPNEKYAEILGAARPDGKIIAPVKYKKIDASGYLVLGRNSTWSDSGDLFNLDGKKLTEELAFIHLHGDQYRSKQGKTYISYSFFPGTEKKSVTGLIDSVGNVLLPFEYRSLEFPNENRPGMLTVGTKDEMTQLLDEESFKVIASAKKMYNLNSKLICLNSDSLYGFMDYSGKILYPMEKMEYKYTDGVIRIKKDGKYGFLDSCATKLTDCMYDEVGDFYENEVFVHAYNTYCGKIDKQGKPVGRNEVLDKDYQENFKLYHWLKVDYKDAYCEAKFPDSVVDIEILGTMILSCTDSLYNCFIYYKRITPDDDGEKWVYDYIMSKYGTVEDMTIQRSSFSGKFEYGMYLFRDSQDIYTRVYLKKSSKRFFVLMMTANQKNEIPSKRYFDQFLMNFKANPYTLD